MKCSGCPSKTQTIRSISKWNQTKSIHANLVQSPVAPPSSYGSQCRVAMCSASCRRTSGRIGVLPICKSVAGTRLRFHVSSRTHTYTYVTLLVSCINTVCNIKHIDWMKCLNRPPARIAINTLQQQSILNEFAIFYLFLNSSAPGEWHANGSMRHDGFANTCLEKNNPRVRVVNSDMYLIYIDSYSCDFMRMFL